MLKGISTAVSDTWLFVSGEIASESVRSSVTEETSEEGKALCLFINIFFAIIYNKSYDFTYL
jgi:hypothetical protein